ncbi:antigenic thaumatin domain protein, putative [Penicillium digitatum]|uniref:Antigenic thaumatin domain-containing protein n=3 Tax=Penicillium digitatum TaxID=36651 RepID=K9FMA0_PEND2|nr:hypothetical protein PDIP_50170 [Penicillium digitatum Pd1]EKV10765.1 hypothetical protein PDIG_54960 [Penicillium digitatum PHI26]EKV13068.1 hypothetical protein PDIP_50170 [Penicillium digitatum Pd1]KAG0155778.1 hypothetical protein PDIDSM_2951 [Penicillium digitatum]QQK43422.1 antigenic thaumatin domain protein, putative [Penicillium digitatum]
MRFNVIGFSALLAITASALPVAIPDVDYVEQTVWETVYETVYQTALPTSTPIGAPISAPISVPTNLAEAVAPSTTVDSSTWTPASSSSNSFSVPTVMPTAASAPSGTSTGPTAAGSGISIVNNLSQTVYLWVVTETAGEMQIVPAGQTFASSTWLTNTNGGGVSIKMSTTEVCDDILQFEYTQSGDILFWDMSSINLSKTSEFVNAGFAVSISDKSCPTSTCAPGDVNCAQSYQQPYDVNTLACGLDAAYTLTLG